MSIKLITIDIDKTLINDNFEIPQANVDTIKKAVDSGVNVVINSGRFNPSVRMYIKQLGISCYVPSLGGALLEDFEGNIIKEHGIKCQTALAIYDIARKYKQNPIVFKRDDWYVDKENTYWYEKEKNATKVDGNSVDLKVFLANNFPNKMLVPTTEPQVLDLIAKEIKSLLADEIDCYLSSPVYLEIMPKGVTKGTVINDLANLLNISNDQVLAIGDYYNDIDMLRAAGHAATVKNAPDDIKNMVEYISPLDNNQGAVAEIINHYLD